MTELDALKAVDEALSGLPEVDARRRVLKWAFEKFLQYEMPSSPSQPDGVTSRSRKTRKEKATRRKASAVSPKAPPVGLVKDLNLKPKGKRSLDELVQEKRPKSLYEKCTLCVYYLRGELSIPAVSVSHIYTCFKQMKWKLPTDLGNTLSYTASRYGWLDSGNMQDLRTTAIGENLVEHDLPRSKKNGD